MAKINSTVLQPQRLAAHGGYLLNARVSVLYFPQLFDSNDEMTLAEYGVKYYPCILGCHIQDVDSGTLVLKAV